MNGKQKPKVLAEISLWASAVAGTVREYSRRRELLARRSDEAIKVAAVEAAARAASKQNKAARRKTVTVIGALVLGSTVPAWALVVSLSAPSAHNGEFREPSGQSQVAEPVTPVEAPPRPPVKAGLPVAAT